MHHAQPDPPGTAPVVSTAQTPDVALVPTTAGEHATLENLALFCTYDFSELIPRDVDDSGTFRGPGAGILRGCWTDPRRHTFLIRVAGKLAGFAIVDDHTPPRDSSSSPSSFNHWEMGEFFILRRYRRAGIGEHAARLLFDRFRGRWVVYTFPQNTAAQRFWSTIIQRRTAGQLTSDRWQGYGGLGYTWCFHNPTPVSLP